MVLKRDPYALYPHDRILARILLPLIPRWVTPNAITMVRFLGTPFVLWFLFMEEFAVGIPLFLFFSSTDALDGTLARVRRQITAWGTFYDPLADKLLIGSVALVVMVRYLPIWIPIVMVIVESLILAGGLLMRRRGLLISANLFGKTKMFLQVTGIALLLFGVAFSSPELVGVSQGVILVSLGFALLSLVTYGL